MSKKFFSLDKSDSNRKSALVVSKKFFIGFLFLFLIGGYLFFSCPDFPNCDKEIKQNGKSMSCQSFDDQLSRELVQWVNEGNFLDSKKESDICSQELDRLKYKKLFVALTQMFKERICGQEMNLYEAKEKFEKIFGKAFPEQSKTFLK